MTPLGVQPSKLSTFFLFLFLVPSQVIVGRTISKKQMLMSVCTKIGIQLNCKLGGEAWAVEIPVSTMFCPNVLANQVEFILSQQE